MTGAYLSLAASFVGLALVAGGALLISMLIWRPAHDQESIQHTHNDLPEGHAHFDEHSGMDHQHPMSLTTNTVAGRTLDVPVFHKTIWPLSSNESLALRRVAHKLSNPRSNFFPDRCLPDTSFRNTTGAQYAMQKITTYAFALLCMAAGSTYADDRDKEIREQYQRYWEHQREMEKADQENNREHRKAHEEMDREERKHYEEMEREEAKRRAEFYREREKAYRE